MSGVCGEEYGDDVSRGSVVKSVLELQILGDKKWRTTMRFGMEEEETWDGVVEKWAKGLEGKKGWRGRSLVTSLEELVWYGKCVESVAFEAMGELAGRKWEKEWSVGTEKWEKAKEMRGVRGWVNGIAGVAKVCSRTGDFYAPGMKMEEMVYSMLGQATQIETGRFYSRFAGMKEVKQEVLDREREWWGKGPREELSEEEWPKVMLMWHQTYRVQHDWRLGRMTGECKRALRRMRERKKVDKIDAASLYWKFMNTVPKEMRDGHWERRMR